MKTRHSSVEIYEIKRKIQALSPTKEFFALIKLSMQVDKAEINKSIKKIRNSLDTKAKAEGYTDVIMVGITCDPPEIFDLFDEIKINIAGDSLIAGTRYLQGIVPDNGGLLRHLPERHLREFSLPSMTMFLKNFEEVKGFSLQGNKRKGYRIRTY